MGRRGVGNIEIVLSFILFIGFIATIIYLFNPMRNVNYMDSTLDYAFGEIKKTATIELEEYSIKLNTDKQEIAIDINDVAASRKAVVTDYYGKRLKAGSSISSDGKRVNFDRNGETFVIVKFCDDFKENSNEVYGTKDYELSTTDSRKVLSEEKIMQMNNSYYSDYNGLKNQLNIPENVDFGFVVELEDKIMRADKNVPARAEVFLKKELVEIVKSDGSSEGGYLSVKVW